MPWTPTITAQGSPGASHSDSPSRAPSKLTTASRSIWAPWNPSGGWPTCCTIRGVQPASIRVARRAATKRVITSKLTSRAFPGCQGLSGRQLRFFLRDQLGEGRALPDLFHIGPRLRMPVRLDRAAAERQGRERARHGDVGEGETVLHQVA